jgi:N-acetylglucosamine-6-phosphate deacetylase
VAALVLGGGRVLTADGWRDTDVVTESGRVAALGRCDSPHALDLSGCSVVPGFVDVHVHAAGGSWPRDPGSLRSMAASLARGGVTSFLLTTIAAPVPELVTLVALAATPPEGGARCLGVHLEGPWLSPQRAGAMPAEHLAAIALGDLALLLDAGPVRMVTVAPELPGATEVIRQLAARGVVASLGHSDAGYDDAVAGFAAGARHVTHAYNAMRGLHHRDPGLLAAALDRPDVTVEVIADGVHVHPSMVRLLWRAVGVRRVCLVSDGVDGDMGHALVRDGSVLRRPDGRLAGSAGSLADAVRHVVGWGIPLDDALAMASATPARLLGLDDPGGIAVGAVADLVVLDGELRVRHTVVGGELVHSAPAC